MRARWSAAVLAVGLLSACGGDTSLNSPTPSPTPLSLAAVVFVLKPAQIPPPLTRTVNTALNPQLLADQRSDPGIINRLGADGFQSGARAIYSVSQAQATGNFSNISCDALLFSDAHGATAFYADEAARIGAKPANGTLTALTVPTSDTDQLVAYDSVLNPTQAGDVASRAYIVLSRRGTVVSEIFASATSTSVAPGAFTPLVSAEESLLASA